MKDYSVFGSEERSRRKIILFWGELEIILFWGEYEKDYSILNFEERSRKNLFCFGERSEIILLWESCEKHSVLNFEVEGLCERYITDYEKGSWRKSIRREVIGRMNFE